MKFYFGPEKEENIIYKYIELESGKIVVWYLNGRMEFIENVTEDTIKQIEDVMLKQLEEKNKSFNMVSIKKKCNLDIILFNSIIGLYIANRLKFDEVKGYLTILSLGVTAFLCKNIVTDMQIINDIRKSKLFLNMYDKLQTAEGKALLEDICINKLYNDNLSINTIDDFSYKSIKTIYKKVKKI